MRRVDNQTAMREAKQETMRKGVRETVRETNLSTLWTRRRWLAQQTGTAMAGLLVGTRRRHLLGRWTPRLDVEQRARLARQSLPLNATPWEALAQQAIDVAHSAGAQYADARLTRLVQHIASAESYSEETPVGGLFATDIELVGVGVRALVDGAWGFSASATITPDTVQRLAQAAVAQGRMNAQGATRRVEVGTVPAVTGRWTTPVRIDPFTIPIEEKMDECAYWGWASQQVGIQEFSGTLSFVRDEQVLATSAGTCVTQTRYESFGDLEVKITYPGNLQVARSVHGLDAAGAGWELFLDAQIAEQMPELRAELDAQYALLRQAKPSTVGRYTLVCDGKTMAGLTACTLGMATQLDRALGYEANAGGTSFLDDPLGMLGQYRVTSPLITLTANRSAPRELATVAWDAEGVVPEESTLLKDGVLVDFQTTREQVAWLAPYYERTGRPQRSHGYAAAADAHLIPMQHMPNLLVQPAAAAVTLDDLAADVKEGLLVEDGFATSDFQGETGVLEGQLREIKNGRVGRLLEGGAVAFTTKTLWHNVQAIGGDATQMRRSGSQYEAHMPLSRPKGEPAQRSGQSVRAVAAIITDQPLIDLQRKA